MKSIAIALVVLAAIVVVTAGYAIARSDSSTGNEDSTTAHAKAGKEHDKRPGSAKARPGKSKDKNDAKTENDRSGRGAEGNVEAIAKQFGASTSDVTALRNQGFGFGAIVQLFALAKAKDMSARDLAAHLPRVNGQPEANFGELFSGLSDQEKARIDGLPRNFGQIKQAQAGRAKGR